MFRLIPEKTNIDFMGKRMIWLSLSAVMVLGSLVAALVIKPKFGIDFAGGLEFVVRFSEPVTANQVRASSEGSTLGSFDVQSYGDSGSSYLVRVRQSETDSVEAGSAAFGAQMNTVFGAGKYEILRQEYVGPKAGAELREKGLWALFYALVAILLYVAVRFEFSYALGSVTALFHDVLIVCGVFIVLGHEFDLQTLAALLTIVGYSINDTIIVFDRIRETAGKRNKGNLEHVMNLAVNDTLSRTVITNLTVLFSVLALYLLSPEGTPIREFGLAMTIGAVVGTYSSIYVASPIVLAWENMMQRRAKAQ